MGVDEDSNYCVEGHDCSNWLLLLHSQGNDSLAPGFLKDNRLLQWGDAFHSIHTRMKIKHNDVTQAVELLCFIIVIELHILILLNLFY